MPKRRVPSNDVAADGRVHSELAIRLAVDLAAPGHAYGSGAAGGEEKVGLL